MQRGWWVVALGLVGVSIACATASPPTAAPGGQRFSLSPTLRVRLIDGRIAQVPFEDYVRATIISEYAPAAEDPALVERMLEVQAVIARSYAVAMGARHGREGFDLCSTTHCQLYQPSRLQTSRWADAARQAARRTAGRVLWFGQAPVQALFHADCGGRISDAGEVWGGPPRPYLAASEDDGPAATAHTAWTFEVESARLATALNTDVRTRVGARLLDIAVLQRDRAGRVSLVALRGAREPLVRGEELRTVLTRELGPKAVRSTSFTVSRTGSRFTFAGRGFGHGVGLCQAGAIARLRAGASPEQVLARYYPGARVLTAPRRR